MKTIGVVGAGQMGSGIAHVAALAGFEALLYDVAAPQLETALVAIGRNLQRQADKRVIKSAAVPAAVERIATATDLEKLSAWDFHAEAFQEIKEVKLELFRKRDGILRPGDILASNLLHFHHPPSRSG